MLHYHFVGRETATVDPLGAIWLEGDNGGHVYAIARVTHVVAGQHALEQLAVDLDAIFGRTFAPATRALWVVTSTWSEWAPAEAASGIWVHAALLETGVSARAIRNVLSGESARLAFDPT